MSAPNIISAIAAAADDDDDDDDDDGDTLRRRQEEKDHQRVENGEPVNLTLALPRCTKQEFKSVLDICSLQSKTSQLPHHIPLPP